MWLSKLVHNRRVVVVCTCQKEDTVHLSCQIMFLYLLIVVCFGICMAHTDIPFISDIDNLCPPSSCPVLVEACQFYKSF